MTKKQFRKDKKKRLEAAKEEMNVPEEQATWNFESLKKDLSPDEDSEAKAFNKWRENFIAEVRAAHQANK